MMRNIMMLNKTTDLMAITSSTFVVLVSVTEARQIPDLYIWLPGHWTVWWGFLTFGLKTFPRFNK